MRRRYLMGDGNGESATIPVPPETAWIRPESSGVWGFDTDVVIQDGWRVESKWTDIDDLNESWKFMFTSDNNSVVLQYGIRILLYRYRGAGAGCFVDLKYKTNVIWMDSKIGQNSDRGTWDIGPYNGKELAIYHDLYDNSRPCTMKKLHWFKIWDSAGTLIAHIVPARNRDTVCLANVVTGVYYMPTGGTWLYGED